MILNIESWPICGSPLVPSRWHECLIFYVTATSQCHHTVSYYSLEVPSFLQCLHLLMPYNLIAVCTSLTTPCANTKLAHRNTQISDDNFLTARPSIDKLSFAHTIGSPWAGPGTII